MEESNSANTKYISLLEASKLCAYSEPYLRLRARQGKLKSIKLGKKWMTTAAWLDDYAARIQEWQELAAARKVAVPEARLVAAPTQLEDNLDRCGDAAPAEEPSAPAAVFAEEPKQEVFPDTAQVKPVAAFCDVEPAIRPPMPPRRLRMLPPSGQIYPVPQETKLDDVASFGWFGALLSGAVCALVLFLSFGYGGIDIAGSFSKSGQASMGRAFDQFENIIILQAEKSGSTAAPQSQKTDPLEQLVEAIAGFFERR
jgi:hypothetical protein